MRLQIWSTEDYTIGLSKIDEQHGQIIQAITAIYDQLEVISDKGTITPLLSHLVQVSRQHFDDEERLMLNHHYPDIESHIGRHMIFTEALANIIVHYQQGHVAIVLEQLKFLSHWTIEHIGTADTHYYDYIVKQTA